MQLTQIIPVLDGFDIDKDPLPDNLSIIRTYNAVALVPEYLDAGIDRIAEFIGLPKK